MIIDIQEGGVDLLPQYAKIPISFEVKSIYQVEMIDHGLGGIRLYEEKVHTPYLKDYDSYAEGGPEQWPKQFDISNWGILLAWVGETCVGGAAIAYNTAGVYMLEGSRDLAVLWDIRVQPDYRRCGVGTALFQHTADWARRRGCKRLKIETQNVNVPTCRFYVRQGCELGIFHRYGYAGHPQVEHEVMLVWYLSL